MEGGGALAVLLGQGGGFAALSLCVCVGCVFIWVSDVCDIGRLCACVAVMCALLWCGVLLYGVCV